MRRRVLFLALAVLLFIFLFVSATAWATGQGNCSSYDEKFEGPGPFVINAPEGQVVSQVTIKSGANMGFCMTPLTSDSNDGCYSVTGIGTGTVNVSHIGSGPNCQDISHVEVVYAPGGEQEIGGSNPPGDNPPGDNPPGDKPPGDNPPGDQSLGENPSSGDTGLKQDPAGGSTSLTSTPGTSNDVLTSAPTTLPSTGLPLFIPLAGMGLLGSAGVTLFRRNR